jgi:hypothetical protein
MSFRWRKDQAATSFAMNAVEICLLGGYTSKPQHQAIRRSSSLLASDLGNPEGLA